MMKGIYGSSQSGDSTKVTAISIAILVLALLSTGASTFCAMMLWNRSPPLSPKYPVQVQESCHPLQNGTAEEYFTQYKLKQEEILHNITEMIEGRTFRFSKQVTPTVTLTTTTPARSNSKYDAATECALQCGFYSLGKCYTIPLLSPLFSIKYSDAFAQCNKTGGHLAEIRDRTQQKALHDYAFTKMPAKRSYVYLWVGMQYDNTTSTLRYRSGGQTPINRFQWDHKPSSSLKYMMLEVGSDGDSSVGLWNCDITRKGHGVLCEKNM